LAVRQKNCQSLEIGPFFGWQALHRRKALPENMGPSSLRLAPLANCGQLVDNVLALHQPEPPMLTDTHPDAERVQIELLRKATGAQRIAKMRSLTSFVVGMSRQAAARANPGLTSREIDLLWVKLNYGQELAGRLRDYLEERQS
jgi:hypothetical protein